MATFGRRDSYDVDNGVQLAPFRKASVEREGKSAPSSRSTTCFVIIGAVVACLLGAAVVALVLWRHSEQGKPASAATDGPPHDSLAGVSTRALPVGPLAYDVSESADAAADPVLDESTDASSSTPATDYQRLGEIIYVADDAESDFLFYDRPLADDRAHVDACAAQRHSMLFTYRSLGPELVRGVGSAVTAARRRLVRSEIIATGVKLDLLADGKTALRRYDGTTAPDPLHLNVSLLCSVEYQSFLDKFDATSKENRLFDILIKIAPGRSACLVLERREAGAPGPTGVTSAICRKRKRPLHMRFTRLATGLELDVDIYRQAVTFDGMLAACGRKDSRPFQTFRRLPDVRLMATLRDKIREANVTAGRDGVLFWSGATFEPLSDEPYVMRLPGNRSRVSLAELARSWCDDSYDYKAVIAKSREKLLDRGTPPSAALKPHSSVAVTLRYSIIDDEPELCLHLFDADVGRYDPDTGSRLVPLCEARRPAGRYLSGSVSPPHSLALDTSQRFAYAKAAAACTTLKGFAIAGSASTNPRVLAATSNAVAIMKSAVWTGGHFDLSSSTARGAGGRYLAWWAGGRLIDPALSPAGVWCNGDPGRVIEEAIQRVAAFGRTDRAFDPILPIVRHPHMSHCLSLYTEDLMWPRSSLLTPLCLQSAALARLLAGNGTLAAAG